MSSPQNLARLALLMALRSRMWRAASDSGAAAAMECARLLADAAVEAERWTHG